MCSLSGFDLISFLILHRFIKLIEILHAFVVSHLVMEAELLSLDSLVGGENNQFIDYLTGFL